MAVAYSKELLIGVYLYRFRNISFEQTEVLYQNADKYYDQVGRDKFRVAATVTPEAIKEFKNSDLF